LNRSDDTIDSLSITVEYILLIILCLLYFFEEISSPNVTFIYSIYNFWIIVGILIYSTGTFFFFMQADDLSDEEWDKWALINYTFTIIKNVFFGIAISMKKEGTAYSRLDKPFEDLSDHPFQSYKP
jgi:hypothetical protein